MTCPQCRHENEAGAKFCEECATPLARACAKCGRPLSPTAKFCPECAYPTGSSAAPAPAQRFDSPESYTPKHLAEKILTSKAALEGERKQVTVLFADLKGSMELLADRDPEDARKLLDPVLEWMMEAVHRYEGTVNQVMGDGIMALFGAPLAHEDHAVRACFAALRMQDAVRRYAEGVRREHGLTLRIRVGLNSGEVVVRAIGSDLHMDYTAVGQTTHLAARMEQLADPGSILLTTETLALAEGFIQVAALGPMAVRGLPGPVEVYELTGVSAIRSRLQATATRGLSRFVGRDAEMEQLRRALEQARQGRGQVAAIVGEPGVGKSRLVFELTHSHRVEGWLVLEAGSVSYGKATSYLPVIDLLKGYFRIADRNTYRDIREKVTGRLLTLDRALELVLPALLALLDVPVEDPQWQGLDPPQRRQRTLDAVKLLLLREAQNQPLLVIFEDLHWIDSETQVFLDTLVESLPTVRLLLLVNYRPEYTHGWGSKPFYTQLRLDTLPPETAGELLDTLLGPDTSLGALKLVLSQKTGGNALFLEETVRTLVETKALVGQRGAYRLAKPVEAVQVPATVQAILASRIDRLPAAEKRLLETAAVIGSDFAFILLRAIADEPDDILHPRLEHLQAAEFVYQTSLFPDLEYAFKHALTHTVAYATILQERRRTLHARIVDAMETLYGDRLDEHIERVAHHAQRGGVRDKTIPYLRQAGLKARWRWALQDARSWFEQALEAIAALPESQATLEQAFEIRLELRPVLTQLGEVQPLLERLCEAEALAERLSDDRRRGRVRAFMTAAHTHFGEPALALESGTKALDLAEHLGDLRLRIVTTSFLVHAHYLRGEYNRAIVLATDNLAALPADWLYESFGRSAPASVYDRSWLAISLAEVGTFAAAAEQAAQMIRLAESTQHAYTVGTAYRAAGLVHLLAGDWAKARALIEQGIVALRAGHIVVLLAFAVAASAWALAQCGELSEALNRLREGEQLLEPRAAESSRGNQGWGYHALGRAYLHLGQLHDAQRLGDRLAETAAGFPGFAAHARHLLGDIATHPDRFDAESGEAHYREALALAEPRGMRPLIAHCHLGLGKLYRRTGDDAKASEHLSTTRAMYREMDMGFWLEKAEAALSGVER
jgi:class 3 adenylate cyclase/tetratricopeptide (TPR) repeat protein